MNEAGEIVGMVDVLKLTYATLEQINSMHSGQDSEGPAWNKFWMSFDNETESVASGDGSFHHTNPTLRSHASPEAGRERVLDSLAPGDSASHLGGDATPPPATPGVPLEEVPFPFKFKAPSGRVHRLQV